MQWAYLVGMWYVQESGQDEQASTHTGGTSTMVSEAPLVATISSENVLFGLWDPDLVTGWDYVPWLEASEKTWGFLPCWFAQGACKSIC
jgi:hypothetical protein